MQRIACLLVLVVVLPGFARADDQADLKAVIEKAIKASGGEANLAKFKAETFKGKGKFYGMGEGIDYTGEWAIQQPNKMRVQIDASAGGMNFTFVRVFDGTKGWIKFNDMTTAVEDKDQLTEMREESHVLWVTRLLPLRDKAFQLAPLGEVKVDGKPAIGVRVSHKDRRDVNLFFDKDRGLLVKVETVVKDPMAGDKEMTQETLYSDFKEIKGALKPTRVLINRDGKKYVENEVTEMEPHDKLDDAVFGKPGN